MITSCHFVAEFRIPHNTVQYSAGHSVSHALRRGNFKRLGDDRFTRWHHCSIYGIRHRNAIMPLSHDRLPLCVAQREAGCGDSDRSAGTSGGVVRSLATNCLFLIALMYDIYVDCIRLLPWVGDVHMPRIIL